jgi:ribose transport system substrate-binding protein
MNRSGTRAALAAAGLILLLAGCTPAVGGDSDPAPSVAATGDAGDCVAAAQEAVDAAREPLDLLVPEEPLDTSSIEGDSIWLVSATMNQAATEAVDGFNAAAEAAGLDPVVFDGQGAVNRFSEGIDQAVAQGASGIVLYGIDPSLVASSLANAEAAGIPVLNTLNGGPDDPVPAGTYANLTLDPYADGQLAAQWALADGGCDVNMIVLTLGTIPLEQAIADGALAQMEESCPDCPVTLLDIDAANFATDIGSQLQTALQQNPDANYIFPTFDSGVPFLTPVIAAAGSQAKVMGHDGVQASLDFIADGTDQDMTVAVPPLGWLGWLFVDSISREILGLEDPGYVIPVQLVDGTNIGDGTSEAVFPEYADYADAFTSAWAGK